MYAEPEKTPVDRTENRLKPLSHGENAAVTGIYKDDDDKYSLQSLLSRQKEGEQE